MVEGKRVEILLDAIYLAAVEELASQQGRPVEAVIERMIAGHSERGVALRLPLQAEIVKALISTARRFRAFGDSSLIAAAYLLSAPVAAAVLNDSGELISANGEFFRQLSLACGEEAEGRDDLAVEFEVPLQNFRLRDTADCVYAVAHLRLGESRVAANLKLVGVPPFCDELFVGYVTDLVEPDQVSLFLTARY
ncbi:MAG: hypothetical protein HY371_08995 [Devosia nanyangense]|nr:hypothetical protein JP74_18915 [Devosia sp. 17-2-E-8]MBI4046942.1 hypothetical protein [Devosia nanyangense]